jgi:hypothetical protein
MRTRIFCAFFMTPQAAPLVPTDQQKPQIIIHQQDMAIETKNDETKPSANQRPSPVY